MSNTDHGTLVKAAEVRFVRLLPGPIERVWDYLTDPEKRGLWLAGGHTDLRVGGTVGLEFQHAQLTPHEEMVPEKYRDDPLEGCDISGIITQCKPPHLFSHTWGNSEVVFELTPEGDRVRLVLTHRKLGDDAEVLSVAAGWHAHVDVLEAKLANVVPPPFWETHTRLEKEYGERFGNG